MIWNAAGGTVSGSFGSMEYVKFGHGDRALALLPGLSDGLATVKGKALALAWPYRMFFDEFTVYMFSRRDNLPSGYSIRDMARDQAEAFEKLGISRVSVVGVSQGGMIAQWLTVDYPSLVEKLVLAVTAPSANELARASVERWMGFAEAGKHKKLMIDTAENSYSEQYLRKFRKVYPALGFAGKPKDYSRFLANSEAILGFDATAEVGKIACPTLIIGGADDKIVGVAASYELNTLIPGSELYVYPEYGHAAYEEAADFNKRIFEFLK
ncbi:MAG: alpha/beta hydrolase [Clostridia bacterium]|nr:alpha/beta hydrolase [Clostridia bacterium]